jgi:hypothetical protein
VPGKEPIDPVVTHPHRYVELPAVRLRLVDWGATVGLSIVKGATTVRDGVLELVLWMESPPYDPVIGTVPAVLGDV